MKQRTNQRFRFLRNVYNLPTSFPSFHDVYVSRTLLDDFVHVSGIETTREEDLDRVRPKGIEREEWYRFERDRVEWFLLWWFLDEGFVFV